MLPFLLPDWLQDIALKSIIVICNNVNEYWMAVMKMTKWLKTTTYHTER